ncbi:MAG: alpha-1,4-glucan--maltose-1-phosphate maltosyltransferase [Candidatus Nanopelagicales bacterium]
MDTDAHDTPDPTAPVPAATPPARKAPAKKATAATKATAAKKAPAKKTAAASKTAATKTAATKTAATRGTARASAAARPAAPEVDPGHGRTGGLVPPPVLDGRFPVIDVEPTVESGRRPAKAVVGEPIPVRATVFREGHDALGVEVVLLRPDGSTAQRVRMVPIGAGMDRWEGWIRPDTEGDGSFRIEAWGDAWATWRHRAEVKVPAGLDVELELTEGALLLDREADAIEAAGASGADVVHSAARVIRDPSLPMEVRLAAALSAEVDEAVERHPLRDHPTACGPWPLRVERRRALYGSWYEMFPRSEGALNDPPVSGTLRAAALRLPAIAALGYDVVYLPPVHPIGTAYRKGRNNTLDPGPGDPGSPWAIGAPEGGHDALHPDLGTMTDFDAFVARTRELGMEVALDLALQASPDHPWVREHPEWFTARADGTIAYAENPPKKYQDIYPLNFDNDPEGLYAEVVRVVRYWMDHGVRIFRVDNPHTKPLWVWDRLFADINATDPDVFFLAEAFTRPPMMRALAEVGFQQSYTYFTWRNGKDELVEYFTELSGPAAAYMRPNVFVNTPDILHAYLQHGGPAAFAIRATLAATLSPTWGVYSGFELFENVAVRPGSEEYLDSEKYQYRPRDWAAAEAEGRTLNPYIARLNQARRSHPALQQLRNLRFHHTDDDAVIAYSKADGDDLVLVVCLLDPHAARETTVWLDMPALGMDWHDQFVAHDEVTGQKWTWGQAVYVRLEPWGDVAHVVHVRRW